LVLLTIVPYFRIYSYSQLKEKATGLCQWILDDCFQNKIKVLGSGTGFLTAGITTHDFKMPKQEFVLYHLLHGILITSTLYITYLSKPGSNLFSWHPFLMTLSMFLLMNEAVLLFSSSWSLLPKKYHRSHHMNSHIVLEVMSLIAVLLGFFSIYLNKNNHGKPHFTSWHGILGLVQIVMICGQVLVGTFAKYRILPIKPYPAAKLKTAHGMIGISIIILASFNLISGWYTAWFVNNSSNMMSFVLSLACVCIQGFISLRAISTNSRIKSLLKSS